MESPSLLDHPALSARLFYAWPNRFDDPFFVQGKEGRLGCWYAHPFPHGLTMLIFHGNAESVKEYRDEVAPELLSLGVNVFLAEYRGYGMSQGKPRLAAMLEDIPLLVNACATHPSRLIFLGRSLGSLYAIHAASLYPQAAGLVLESAIADPMELLLSRLEPRQLGVTGNELGRELARVFDQQNKLARFRGRTLVMHCLLDDMVSRDQAVLLHAWAPEPKELVMFPRGNHDTIRGANREAYRDRLERLIAAIRTVAPSRRVLPA